MEYTFPDYKKGLINVICSIEKYFKVPSKHNSLDLLDKILNKVWKTIKLNLYIYFKW